LAENNRFRNYPNCFLGENTKPENSRVRMACGIQMLPIGLYSDRTVFSNSNILESDDAEKIGNFSEAGWRTGTSLTAESSSGTPHK
jgi:hypothetical protein